MKFEDLVILLLVVDQLLKALNQWAPWELAESWDQVGLQVGTLSRTLTRVLVAVDLNDAVLEAGLSHRVDGFIVHHPLIFRPLTQIDPRTVPGRYIASLIRNDCFLIAAHTNADIAVDGINRDLTTRFGLEQVTALKPISGKVQDGLGHIGLLKEPLSLIELCNLVRTVLKAKALRMAGDHEKIIRRLAICSGNGGSLIRQVLEQNADAYLTGELDYHDVMEASAEGLATIEAGHWTTERGFIPLVAGFLQQTFSEQILEIISDNTTQEEPFQTLV